MVLDPSIGIKRSVSHSIMTPNQWERFTRIKIYHRYKIHMSFDTKHSQKEEKIDFSGLNSLVKYKQILVPLNLNQKFWQRNRNLRHRVTVGASTYGTPTSSEWSLLRRCRCRRNRKSRWRLKWSKISLSATRRICLLRSTAADMASLLAWRHSII